MPQADPHAHKRAMLARAYADNACSHVAFVDESYLAPAHQRPEAECFYIATAFVAPVVSQQALRDGLRQIVGGRFWHTTEAHRTGRRETITQLLRFIGEGPHDEHLLLSVLKPVSLVVFEERKRQTQRHADEKTIRVARAAGAIDRNTRVFPASPSYEPLLWVPDVVSFAEYHRQIGSRAGYVDIVADRLRYIDASALAATPAR